jgi:WD40 repeat protein/transcriptional regulator with XRE-family HTH domain
MADGTAAGQPGLEFAGLLRQLRTEARLTQEELAEAASLSPRSISDLERGINRTARKVTAELLAGALGLAGPAGTAFVAAARGRMPAAAALATVRAGAGAAAADDQVPDGGPAWCPYLGLAPFEERDARVFYGRGDLVEQLVRRLADRLDEPGILVLAGESGAGKSSLLRAGLLPRLAAAALGPGSDDWPRLVMRPTGSPLRELALQLAGVAGTDPVSVHRSLSAAPGEAPMLVEAAVRTAIGGLGSSAADHPADDGGVAPRLIVVIDQFEELFTTDGDAEVGEAERQSFIAALHAAATVPAGPRHRPPALVVAAVRADLVGRLIGYPPLQAAVDSGLFTVGRMSEAELRLVVTGPAAEAGLAVEPALAEAVIEELREGAAGPGSGALPLVSQAMAATWEYRERGELTVRAYRRAGGAADAVNRAAQAAYDVLSDAQQDAARLVFAQLTAVTEDGRFVRRPGRRSDLRSVAERSPAAPGTRDIDAVIDVFSARRLLVLGTDSVEISHDVLLQAWKRLRDWLGDDQLDHSLYGQIVGDAQNWDASERDSSYLYLPGRLAAIDAAIGRWREAPARFPALPAVAEAFLTAAHRAASRGARRRRAVLAGLLTLTVIAVTAAGIAVHDTGTALREKQLALREKAIAVSEATNASRQHAIALSEELAAQSLAADGTDLVTARRLAVAAWRVFPTDQARTAMTTLLTEQQENGTILAVDPSSSGVDAVTVNPAGTVLASADDNGAVRLWDVASEQALGAPIEADPGGSITGLAFSPDGKLLVVTANNGVRLWNPATGRPVGAPLPADAVTFSPDGALLGITVDGTGLVRVRNLATGRLVGVPLRADADGVAAVSPDDRLLVTIDADDSSVQLWNLASGHAIGAPLPAGVDKDDTVAGAAFSPSGTLLAVADLNGVQLWNPATAHPVGAAIPGNPNDDGSDLAFSPDGRLLAIANYDGTVQLWNPLTGKAAGAPLEADSDAGGGVNVVAFGPDGNLLASGDADGTVRLWDPITRRAPHAAIAADAAGGVNGVAFSPNGALLASAGGNGDGGGDVRLWDPATGGPVGAAIPADPADGVAGVAFSPNGTLLATADEDGDVQLWNPATGRPADAPVRASAGGAGVDFPGVNGVAFSPNGTLLATAGGDGTVRLWNPATGAAARAAIQADPADGVNEVAFSPNGTLLASADADGDVQLWNLATGGSVGAPLQADAADAVNGMAFSANGKLLATANENGDVGLWNSATGSPAGAPLAADPTGTVTAVAFSPNGELLAAADGDGTVQLWNAATGQPLGSPLVADQADGVNGLAFSPDGTLLASSDGDGDVQIWQVSLFADPYAALCADVGPPTKADWAQYAPGQPQPDVCG